MVSFKLVLKLFQIFSLLNSVATSAEDDEKTLFEKEMEIISKLMGYCPYCDPNFIDIPNLQSAMKGYDLPMGDPNRKCMQGFEKKMLFFCTFFPIFTWAGTLKSRYSEQICQTLFVHYIE